MHRAHSRSMRTGGGSESLLPGEGRQPLQAESQYRENYKSLCPEPSLVFIHDLKSLANKGQAKEKEDITKF